MFTKLELIRRHSSLLIYILLIFNTLYEAINSASFKHALMKRAKKHHELKAHGDVKVAP